MAKVTGVDGAPTSTPVLPGGEGCAVRDICENGDREERAVPSPCIIQLGRE